MGSQKDKSTVDRRSFLAASAAGAVVAAGAPSALAKGAASTRAKATLAAGSDLGRGWTVESLGGVEAGAVRLVALHAATDRRANVAICRAEARSGALASTGAVDLFVMNDGKDGQALTPDDVVRMVQRVAKQLEGVEEQIPGAVRLLGKAERLRAFNPIDHLEPIAE